MSDTGMGQHGFTAVSTGLCRKIGSIIAGNDEMVLGGKKNSPAEKEKINYLLSQKRKEGRKGKADINGKEETRRRARCLSRKSL